MVKIFNVPFAEDGDRAPIPETTQMNGEVSYQQGYGFDYERPPEDENRKLIERDQANQLYHDITAALGEIQKLGAARWQVSAGPYPVGAQVFHGPGIWSAVAATSQEPGAGSDWVRTPGRQDMTPIGVALPYFGALADIPPNYAICNGQNGTPNLVDRFLVGAGGKYAANTSGGSTTTESAGTHNHAVTVQGHALTIAQMPPHTHPISPAVISDAGSSSDGPQKENDGTAISTTGSTGGGQPHSHGATSGNAGLHTHTTTPPYYAVVWIMRMS